MIGQTNHRSTWSSRNNLPKLNIIQYYSKVDQNKLISAKSNLKIKLGCFHFSAKLNIMGKFSHEHVW
jgi:hypothetical protein